MFKGNILNRKIYLILTFLVFFVFFSCPQKQAKTPSEDDTLLNTLPALQDAGFFTLKQPAEPNDFTATLLNGENVNLSDYYGKVIILNFWATWCSSCQEEMPSREIFYKRFKNKGLEILAVNLEEDTGTVQKFIDDKGYTFPVLLDSCDEASIETLMT